MDSPYEALGQRAFWRSGVVGSSPFSVDKVFQKKWSISPDWKIATAGSCFAQHVARHLKTKGYNVLDLETPPKILPTELHTKFGYSMYSCRYGNIYTAKQLLQLAREVIGEYKPSDFVWEKEGKFYDAFRPAVEPLGLDSTEEVILHRKSHLQNVRVMFESMDLFVFTLGLTEAWVNKEDGTVYPIAPGTIAGSFDKSKYEFKNFDFMETLDAMRSFRQIVQDLRGGRSQFKMLLTVSPVPLTATASGDHVLVANSYSKSTLRSVAGTLSAENQEIDYFPSYEIITNQAARGLFYEENLRSVRPEGVNTAMDAFFAEHTMTNENRLTSSLSLEKQVDDVQCEEALLEEFGQ